MAVDVGGLAKGFRDGFKVHHLSGNVQEWTIERYQVGGWYRLNRGTRDDQESYSGEVLRSQPRTHEATTASPGVGARCVVHVDRVFENLLRAD
jgi:hypothetical protein